MQKSSPTEYQNERLVGEDGTKIYLPASSRHTLGEFLAKLNTETKANDDSEIQ